MSLKDIFAVTTIIFLLIVAIITIAIALNCLAVTGGIPLWLLIGVGASLFYIIFFFIWMSEA